MPASKLPGRFRSASTNARAGNRRCRWSTVALLSKDRTEPLTAYPPRRRLSMTWPAMYPAQPTKSQSQNRDPHPHWLAKQVLLLCWRFDAVTPQYTAPHSASGSKLDPPPPHLTRP